MGKEGKLGSRAFCPGSNLFSPWNKTSGLSIENLVTSQSNNLVASQWDNLVASQSENLVASQPET